MIVDLFLVYQFIRRLATPFDKWEAFKLGIIDEKGKVLIKRKDFTKKAQRQAWGIYDIMIANLKKILAKVPGGSSRLASYAAALYLIKEYKAFTPDSLINEDLDEDQLNESLSVFNDTYINYIQLAENVNSLNEAARVVWKKAGNNGEIQATIGGKKYQIEKALDHNERHKGEWKVMVWDKRRDSWEWETTEYGKANAKDWIMNRLKEENIEEETPANSVAGGGIEGMDGSAMSVAAQKRWTKKNKSKKKTLRDIMKGGLA